MRLPRNVYMLQHNVTKRIYVGSSFRPELRYMDHIWALRKGNHKVEDMQKDFNTYGEDFSFYIIDDITCIDECVKEQEWMDKLSTCIRGIGYNYKDHHARKGVKKGEKHECQRN